MSVSTWDAFSASSFERSRLRQRRRQSELDKPVSSPLVTRAPAAAKPANAKRFANSRSVAGLALIWLAVAGLHIVVARNWDTTPPAPAPVKQQVVVELIKPKPPEPEIKPEPPKPLPQKAAPPKKVNVAPTPAPPAPTSLVAEPTVSDVPAAVVIQASAPAAVAAPAAPEPVTPPTGYASYLHNPAPAYPESAQRMGLEGKVILKVRVLASGKPSSVEVQASSGRKSLDEAAIAAVRGWTFAPARRGQTPIDGWATVPIEFKLEN